MVHPNLDAEARKEWPNQGYMLSLVGGVVQGDGLKLTINLLDYLVWKFPIHLSPVPSWSRDLSQLLNPVDPTPTSFYTR